MPTPPTPNKAEDAEREMKATLTLILSNEAKFVDLNHFDECLHKILELFRSQRHKLLAEIEDGLTGKLTLTKYQLWVMAAEIANANSEDHNDDEIIEPVFNQLRAVLAAVRAVLKEMQ